MAVAEGNWSSTRWKEGRDEEKMSRGSPRGGGGRGRARRRREGEGGGAPFACKCSFVPFCGDQLSREIGRLLALSSFPLSLSSFATNERRASERAGNGNKKGRLERDALAPSLPRYTTTTNSTKSGKVVSSLSLPPPIYDFRRHAGF